MADEFVDLQDPYISDTHKVTKGNMGAPHIIEWCDPDSGDYCKLKNEVEGLNFDLSDPKIHNVDRLAKGDFVKAYPARASGKFSRVSYLQGSRDEDHAPPVGTVGFVKTKNLQILSDHHGVDAGAIISQLQHHPPDPEDIKQGPLGDCWVMATLMTMCVVDKSLVLNLFLPGATKEKYVVALPVGSDSVPVKLRLNSSLPYRNLETGEDRVGFALTSKVQWVAMLEKALVAYLVPANRARTAALPTQYHLIAHDNIIWANRPRIITLLTGYKQFDFNIKHKERVENTVPPRHETNVEKLEVCLKEVVTLVYWSMEKKRCIFLGTKTSAGPTERMLAQQQYLHIGAPAALANGETPGAGIFMSHAYAVCGIERDGRLVYIEVVNPNDIKYGRTKYGRGGMFKVHERNRRSFVELHDLLDGFGTVSHTIPPEEMDEARAAAIQAGLFSQDNALENYPLQPVPRPRNQLM